MSAMSYRVHVILAGAWRRRYALVLPWLILPVVGALVGTLSPQRYDNHTTFLIQETAKMNPFLEDLAVSANLKERMAGLETLLHSRHILADVAEKQGMLKDKDDEEKERIIETLSSSLQVDMAGKDLIRIDYTAYQAEGMRETLMAVRERFIEQLLAPERSSIKDSAYFLSQHLGHRRDDLEKAEKALAEFKQNNADELPQLHDAHISRLAALRQRLAEREAELVGAEKAQRTLSQRLGSTNPVVGRLEEQIVTVRSSLALLRSRYTDQHSKVQAAERALSRLEEERLRLLRETPEVGDPDQFWDMAAGLSHEEGDAKVQALLVSQLEQLQAARSRSESLNEEVEHLKQRIETMAAKTTSFGEQERRLQTLERDLVVKRKLYDDLLHRYEMARVTGSLGNFEQGERIKIIDQPYTPLSPSNPPLILFIIGGLIGGIALGAGLALILELTDTSIRRREQLEELLGVPVLARVPGV